MGYLHDLFINEAKAVLPKGGSSSSSGSGIDPAILAQGGIGYTETKETTLFPKQTLEFQPDGNTFVYSGATDVPIIVGEKYITVLDNVKYESTAFMVPDNEMVVIGNISLATLDDSQDTGEPFIVAYSAGTFIIIIAVTGTTHTIEITHVDEIVNGINPKFLPEGGFGYGSEGETILDVSLATTPGTTNTETYYSSQITSYSLVEGETYTVITDSGEFTTVCAKISVDENSYLYIGNGVNAGMADTGEPFVYLEGMVDGNLGSMFTDFDGGTKAVIKTNGTIHRIDPKFLPEGGFGYGSEGEVMLDVALTYNSEDNLGTYMTPITSYSLVEGETYTVIVDSGEFTATCTKMLMDEYVFLYIGNSGAFAGGTDTGEPFIYVEGIVDGEMSSSFMDLAGGTKAVIKTAGTIHRIDPKFLPEGGFGYGSEGKIINQAALSVDPGFAAEYTVGAVGLTSWNIVVGETYTVITDSGEFTAVCKESSNGLTRWIGNAFMAGQGDSGESFAYIEGVDDNLAIFIDYNAGTKMIVKIPDVINTIDPKYIPDSVKITKPYADTLSAGFSGTVVPDADITVQMGDTTLEFCLISEFTPTEEEIMAGRATTTPMGLGNDVAMPEFIDNTVVLGDILMLGQGEYPYFIIVYKSGTINIPDIGAVYIPKTGMYILRDVAADCASQGWSITLTWTGMVDKIDPKYLHDGGTGYVTKGEVLHDVALSTLNSDAWGVTVGIKNAYVGSWGLTVGKTYIVITDSGEFTAVCKTDSSGIYRWLGNAKYLNFGDSGESFIYYEHIYAENRSFVDLNVGTKMIIKTADVVHKIDPKYLPEMSIDTDAFATKEYVDQLILGAIGGSY